VGKARAVSKKEGAKMMSYLGLVEYLDKNYHKFFTGKNEKKLQQQASDWVSSVLQEHGTNNVRATIAIVEYSISG
jgi:hypothetical protein